MGVKILLALSGAAGLLGAGCAFQSPAKVGSNPEIQVRDEKTLVQVFASMYAKRNYDRFATLLADEPGAPYRFVLNEPTQEGVSGWDLATELRIHKRMFEPGKLPVGEPQVAPELTIRALDLRLAPQGEFVEHPEWYRSESNPGGLDPSRWRVTEATYSVDALFDLAGENDYSVRGRADFWVLDDLQKAVEEPGKFRIFRCEDLGVPPKPMRNVAASGMPNPASVEEVTWGTIKNYYRLNRIVPRRF